MADVSFPFDPTGSAPSNLITGELHTLTEVNDAPYRTLIPTFAPFYLTNQLLEHIDALGVATELKEGVDFYAILPYMAAARSTGRAVYGGWSFVSTLPQGTIRVKYQTVGDKWCADKDFVYARLLEAEFNKRSVWWDQITSVQEIFPPIEHTHTDPMAINGMTEMLAMMEKIREAILTAGSNAPASYVAHLISTGNVHGMTKEDLDLGNVQNLPMATDQEVLARVPADKYLTLRQVLMLLNQ